MRSRGAHLATFKIMQVFLHIGDELILIEINNLEYNNEVADLLQ